MIETKCKSCGALIRGPEQLEGKELKCPKCKSPVVLKAAAAPQKASAAPQKALPKADKAPAKAAKVVPKPKDDDDEDVSAKDLLSEISGKPSVPSPAQASAKPAASAAEPSAKVVAPAKPPRARAPVVAFPAERGLPINLIVSVVGVAAVAVTAYIIYQKDQAGKEESRTRQIVKKIETELDTVRAAVKSARDLMGGADFAKAKDALQETQSQIDRVKRSIDLELGSVSSEFSRGQRTALEEEADRIKGEVDGVLAEIDRSLQDTKEVTEFVEARKGEMAGVEKSISKAQQQIKDMDYVSAKSTLGRAKSDIEEIVEQIEEKGSDIKGDALGKRIDECKVEADKHLQSIRTLLQSDEIMQGSKGLVKHKDKWVTPEEKKAAEEAKQPAAAPAPQGGTPAKPAAAEFKPGDTEWLLDDMSGVLRWARLAWGDDAEVSIQEVNGDKVLFVRYAPGAQGKVALSRGGRLDFSTRGLLAADIENRGAQPVNVCLAVWTDRMYESQAQSIPAGVNKGVSFSLTGALYKCDKDNWQSYSFQIENPETVNQIIFMIYPSAPGVIVLDNVKLIAK